MLDSRLTSGSIPRRCVQRPSPVVDVSVAASPERPGEAPPIRDRQSMALFSVRALGFPHIRRNDRFVSWTCCALRFSLMIDLASFLALNGQFRSVRLKQMEMSHALCINRSVDARAD